MSTKIDFFESGPQQGDVITTIGSGADVILAGLNPVGTASEATLVSTDGIVNKYRASSAALAAIGLVVSE